MWYISVYKDITLSVISMKCYSMITNTQIKTTHASLQSNTKFKYHDQAPFIGVMHSPKF